MSAADGSVSSRSDGGVAGAGSSGMNGRVGRGRGCGRGQVSSRVSRSVYRSTLHVARKLSNSSLELVSMLPDLLENFKILFIRCWRTFGDDKLKI